MTKKSSILFSKELVKLAYAPAPGSFVPVQTAGDAAMGVGFNGLYGFDAYKGFRAAQTATGLANPGFTNTLKATAPRLAGGIAAPLGVAATAYNGYRAVNSAVDANRAFNQSGYANGPIGSRGAWAIDTTEGRNRIFGDTLQNGGLSTIGAGVGAGIGSMAGGIGALPGAVIGGVVGGVAELGVGVYRSATGWDGNKYDQAKTFHKGNLGAQDAASFVGEALADKTGGKMFETKKLFGGTRDLGAEAFSDIQKGNQMAQASQNNAFQKNIS